MNRKLRLVFSGRGFSLAEVMLFSALAILIGGIASDLYLRGTSITDETQKAVMVQQDIRAVVEYITRDMNGTYWVLNPNQGYEHNLVLIKFGSYNTVERLRANIAAGDHFDYPFSRAGESVSNKMDAVRVTYEYDENEQTVYRTEENGIFSLATDAASSAYATDYSFEASGDGIPRRALATNVKQFDLYYFGYEKAPDDARGALKQVWDLKFLESLSDDVKIGMTACILLRVMANYKEGMYRDGGRRRAPETTIVTKIWSYYRLKDEMYKEYFSSTDWNLQY